MVVDLLVRGFWIGLAISVPVGPVGVMIIRRTLAEGLPAGVLAGLGSATGMALYGGIAGFGLTAVSGFLVSQQRPLKLLGGILLVYLGFSIARAAPPLAVEATRRGNLAGAFATTFVLTAISPAVLIYFLALFANVGLLRPGGDYGEAAALVAGVFTGAAAWWLTLSVVVALLRSRLRARWLQLANQSSGAGIALFGVLVLLQLR